MPGIGRPAFPLSRNQDELENWLDTLTLPGGGTLGTTLRAAIGAETDSIVRALDRRIQAGAFGSREVARSLVAAIQRAQDLIYLETPALDDLPNGTDEDELNPWESLISRVTSQQGLHVVICVPTLLAAGAPRMLQAVRNQGMLRALESLRTAAGDRVAVFSPGAGAGRALRFASSTVVVDDVLAITGTTHLWRRGLTFDSSLAAAVFDERTTDGRSSEVRAFRVRLLADRLGLPVTRLPDDAIELVRAVREFDQRGSVRLSATPIVAPDPAPTPADEDAWNPDGTRTDLTLPAIVALFEAAVALTDIDHAIIEG
jgi:hypothetical protein